MQYRIVRKDTEEELVAPTRYKTYREIVSKIKEMNLNIDEIDLEFPDNLSLVRKSASIVLKAELERQTKPLRKPRADKGSTHSKKAPPEKRIRRGLYFVYIQGSAGCSLSAGTTKESLVGFLESQPPEPDRVVRVIQGRELTFVRKVSFKLSIVK